MTAISEAILKNTRGISLVLHDPLVVQMLRSHADFFVLDCAARPCAPEKIAMLHQAAVEVPFLVRPAATDRATLQGLLNLGIDGFVLSDIQFAAELEKIIASCLYAPEGNRPYRPLLAGDVSLETLNDQITFVVEIAHPQAVAQLEQIAEVTGVNGLLAAPERLAVAMEHGRDTTHSAVKSALQSIARVAKSYELPFGIEGPGDAAFNADFTMALRDIDLLSQSLHQVTSREMAPDGDLPMESFPFFLKATRE